jgi:hypothetical protein
MGGWVSRLGRASGQRGRWGSGPATLPQRTDAEARLRPSTLSTTRPPRCYHATGAGVRAQGVNAVRMCVRVSLPSMSQAARISSPQCAQSAVCTRRVVDNDKTSGSPHAPLPRFCMTRFAAPVSLTCEPLGPASVNRALNLSLGTGGKEARPANHMSSFHAAAQVPADTQAAQSRSPAGYCPAQQPAQPAASLARTSVPSASLRASPVLHVPSHPPSRRSGL